MDRFIGIRPAVLVVALTYLKSSMDRFIAQQSRLKLRTLRHLKSSMDRFIDHMSEQGIPYFIAFKIQYG